MSFALATKASTALPSTSQRAASGTRLQASWAARAGIERAIDVGGGVQRPFDVDPAVDGTDGLQGLGHALALK